MLAGILVPPLLPVPAIGGAAYALPGGAVSAARRASALGDDGDPAPAVAVPLLSAELGFVCTGGCVHVRVVGS